MKPSDGKLKKPQVDIRRLKVEEFKFSPLQDRTWYPARYENAEVKNGMFGQIVFLKFTILGGVRDDGEPAKGSRTSSMTGVELTPNSKLMNLLRGMSGQDEFDVGEEVDLTAHYGEKFDIFIENKADKKTGTVRSNIAAIAPYHHQKMKKKKKH